MNQAATPAPLDFLGADTWTPNEGGGGDLLTHDGTFHVKFANVKLTTAKTSGNWMYAGDLVVQDADENKGKTMPFYKPYSGEIQSGTNKGKSNKEGAWQMFASAGMTPEMRSKLAVAAKAGKAPKAEDFVKWLEGRDGYVTAEAEDYKGNWSSKVQFFQTKERYEMDKALGSHRKALPAGAGRGGASSGGDEASQQGASQASAGDILGITDDAPAGPSDNGVAPEAAAIPAEAPAGGVDLGSIV